MEDKELEMYIPITAKAGTAILVVIIVVKLLLTDSHGTCTLHFTLAYHLKQDTLGHGLLHLDTSA